MKAVRRIALWGALLAMGALVVLSIVGAVQDVEDATEMFNSVPMAVFWFLLAGILILGFLAFKRLIRSPALLAVHLGALLILAGSMYGSRSGHAVAAKLLDFEKTPDGYMQIPEGYFANVVYDGHGKPLGALPFNIGLKDFWIERYEVSGPWLLVVDAPPGSPGRSHDRRQRVIDWAVGKWTDVPFTGAGLKVLQYIPSARPTYSEDAVHGLEVTQADGKKIVVPAKPGQKVSTDNPKGELEIVEVFSNMLVQNGKATDVPGSAGPPALKVEFRDPDGKKSYGFVYGGVLSGRGQGTGDLKLRYLLPKAVGASPDPDTHLPAAEVLLTYKGKKLRQWLFAQHPRRPVRFSLGPLLGTRASLDSDGHIHRETYLVMVAREGPIRDYKSRLVVLEENRPVMEKVIEVNDPLHHGGYHFYQHFYDAKHERYTVLSVKSDSGLWPVYAGFALLCAGTFWLMWVRRGEKGPISLERAAYRIVCLGFPLLTLGLVLGCIWAKIAWGDYWNWDPKELWSLISWLVFLSYLHVRYMYGKKYPRLNSSLVVTGLVAIVLTLLWVNLSQVFSSGLHSYSGSRSAIAVKETRLGLLIMLAMAAYAAAAVVLLSKRRKLGSAVFCLGCVLTATAFVVRWVEVGHVPMQNLFEVFLCMGLVIYPISVLCRRFLQVGGEAFDALLGFVVLFPAAFVFGAEPQRLPPALQSWLFAPHVATYMLAYVMLAKAAVQAFGQLFVTADQSRAAPAS